MNTTGASNITYTLGAPPCPDCGGDRRVSDEFHGYWWTACVHCGADLS